MFNYVMSYTGANNKEDENEENKNNNNTDDKGNFFYKKLRTEDFDFIKRKTKGLGEDFEINNYNEKINRLNDGLKK